MAAVEIADAYIALYTKMPGVKNDITKALGGSDVQGAVETSGQGLGGKLVSGLGGVVKAGAVAVGAVAAAGLGTALVKGFSRLQALDQAEAKLTGLGHSAAGVEDIMDNALASVRGTAFGMGDAATVAASAVAAGIKPGQDLERTLKLVADASTIAGTDMSSMGAIFNKVAASNKVQMDTINQLHDAGVPALALLADEMGVTAEEASKMASAGKIDFETFQKAMEAGLGGAALESGNTFSGAMANVGAALGRIGAGVLGGVFPQIAPLFQAITTALGPLEDKAGAIGETIGRVLAPAFEWLINALEGGVDVSGFIGIASQLSPIGLAFKALMPVLPVIAAAFGQIAGVLGGVLAQVLPILLPLIVTLVTMFANLAAQILPMLLPVIVQLATLLGMVFAAVAPLVMTLVSALMPILEAIIPVVATLFQAFLPLISALVTALAPILTLVAQVLGAVLVPIINIVVGVIQVLAAVITWLVQNIIAPFFQGVVIPIVQTVGQAFTDAFSGLGDFFSGLWEGIKNGFTGFVNFIIDGINGFLGVLNGVGGALSAVTGGAVDVSFPTLPRLAEGGVVSRRPGGIPAIVGEGRYDEAVIPLSPKVLSAIGGGSVSKSPVVNVYPQPGMSEAAIGQVAVSELNWVLRGA